MLSVLIITDGILNIHRIYTLLPVLNYTRGTSPPPCVCVVRTAQPLLISATTHMGEGMCKACGRI